MRRKKTINGSRKEVVGRISCFHLGIVDAERDLEDQSHDSRDVDRNLRLCQRVSNDQSEKEWKEGEKKDLALSFRIDVRNFGQKTSSDGIVGPDQVAVFEGHVFGVVRSCHFQQDALSNLEREIGQVKGLSAKVKQQILFVFVFQSIRR